LPGRNAGIRTGTVTVVSYTKRKGYAFQGHYMSR
jgi:hypothetical protein